MSQKTKKPLIFENQNIVFYSSIFNMKGFKDRNTMDHSFRRPYSIKRLHFISIKSSIAK